MNQSSRSAYGDRTPRDRRPSLRLKGYDYSLPGAYFITVVTEELRPLLGDVRDGVVHLNGAGRMVEQRWLQLAKEHAGQLELDAFVVMPNHLHGILALLDPAELSLSRVMQAWKSITTNDYIRGVRGLRWDPFEGRLWHRNFYDHVIRNEADLRRIREYVEANPARWANDEDNPANARWLK